MNLGGASFSSAFLQEWKGWQCKLQGKAKFGEDLSQLSFNTVIVILTDLIE